MVLMQRLPSLSRSISMGSMTNKGHGIPVENARLRVQMLPSLRQTKGLVQSPKERAPQKLRPVGRPPPQHKLRTGASASIVGGYRISELYNSAFPTCARIGIRKQAIAGEMEGRIGKRQTVTRMSLRVPSVGVLGRNCQVFKVYLLKRPNSLHDCLYLASLHRPFFALVARANPSLPHFLLITVSFLHPSSVSRAVHPQDRPIPERGTS